MSNVIAIAEAADYWLALRDDGTIFEEGINIYGQGAAPSVTNAVAVAASGAYSMALVSDGTVAVGGSPPTALPPGLTNIAAIAAGPNDSLALSSNGTVIAWGTDLYGEADVPAGLSNVAGIAEGVFQSLALSSNGTVVAWGDNLNRETSVPPGLSNVVAIATGGTGSYSNYTAFDMALKADGTVVVWGDNTYGETNVPPGLSNVTAIAAGDEHCLALTTGGTIVAWGDNTDGEINVPFGLSNVVAIAAGSRNSLAFAPSTPPPPTNCDVTNATPLSGDPAWFFGSNIGAKIQSDYFGTNEAGVWWTWIAPTTEQVILYVSQDTVSRHAVVFTGTNVTNFAQLKLTPYLEPIKGGYDGWGFSATASNKYYIEYDGGPNGTNAPTEGTFEGFIGACSPKITSVTTAVSMQTVPYNYVYGGSDTNLTNVLCVTFNAQTVGYMDYYYSWQVTMGNQSYLWNSEYPSVQLFPGTNATMQAMPDFINYCGGAGGVITFGADLSIVGHPASLQCVFQPPAAVAAGAGWRLAGDSSYNSSSYIAVITNSNVKVQFKTNVPGWIAPPAQVISLSPRQVLTNLASYTVAKPTMTLSSKGGVGITGTKNSTFVIQSRDSLSSGAWVSASTNTITNSAFTPLLPFPTNAGPSIFYRALWLTNNTLNP